MMIKRQAPTTPNPQRVRLPFTVDSIGELRIQRADDDEIDALRVEGHASVFGYEYRVYGGPPWGWFERIEPGAFDETLAEDPDVVFLRNHEGMPLARTKSGTLALSVDDIGLAVRADLDLANPEVRALASALDRKDVDEMSFAFRVTDQVWSAHPDFEDDPESLRAVTGVNLNRGDVSAVTFGASDATDLDIMRSIDLLDERELIEARAAIERRIGNTTPGGTPGQVERGGMPPVDLALLRIPSNPLLEEFAHADQGADQEPARGARRAS